MHKILFYNKFYYIPLHVSSTIVVIIRRSRLYYTASGIITPAGGRAVHRLCIKLVNYWDYTEMHGQQNVKICDAKQAKQVHQYKNTKKNLYKSNAAIWCNKTSIIKQLIPTNVNISVNGNNPRCQRTKNAASRYRINHSLVSVWWYQMLYSTILTSWWWAQ